uniref:Uncharacterized protein n=1 Tax=Sphaerodactylus townsendi TaxID=933632 RepID=A0ACB8E702_9SAUR
MNPKYYIEKIHTRSLKAQHIDKANIRGYFAFKLTDEKRILTDSVLHLTPKPNLLWLNGVSVAVGRRSG